MPDLNDDLFADFKNEGDPVNPLPASEVRRRGDRMRRRNNTLAAVGGVAAAMVVITTPLAVVANQGADDSEKEYAGPTRVTWTQTIPDTVDVAVGMGGPASAAPEVSDEPGVATVEVCGETVFDASDGPVDVAGATRAGDPGTDDGGSQRTLALYVDGLAADIAVDDLVDAVRDCTSEPAGGGDTRTYEVTEADLPADEAYVVARGLQRAGDDFWESVDYYVVARTGNAVLVTEHPGAATGNEQFVQDDAAELVEQLSTFSEANAMVVETDDVAELDALIPDEFPLLAGLPEVTGLPAPFGRKGPARDLNLRYLKTDLTACGASLEGRNLREPIDSLYAGLRAPEGPQLRQLSLFASEEDAQLFTLGVRAFFAACSEEPVDETVTRVYQPVEMSGVGDEATTTVARYEVDGEPGPGFFLVQVVRVGASVLLFTTIQDGGVGVEPVDPTRAEELAASYLAQNGPVIDAM